MSPFFRRRRTQKKSKKEKINIKKVVHYIPDSGVQYKPESIVHYIPEYSVWYKTNLAGILREAYPLYEPRLPKLSKRQ